MKKTMTLLLLTAVLAMPAFAGKQNAEEKFKEYADKSATIQVGATSAEVIQALGNPYERMVRKATETRMEELWRYPTGKTGSVSILFANGKVEQIKKDVKSFEMIEEKKLSEKTAQKRQKIAEVAIGYSKDLIKGVAGGPDHIIMYSPQAPKKDGWYYVTGNRLTILMFTDDRLDGIVERLVTKKEISSIRAVDALPRQGVALDSTNPGVSEDIGGGPN